MPDNYFQLYFSDIPKHLCSWLYTLGTPLYKQLIDDVVLQPAQESADSNFRVWSPLRRQRFEQLILYTPCVILHRPRQRWFQCIRIPTILYGTTVVRRMDGGRWCLYGVLQSSPGLLKGASGKGPIITVCEWFSKQSIDVNSDGYVCQGDFSYFI